MTRGRMQGGSRMGADDMKWARAAMGLLAVGMIIGALLGT